jgi:hypothetical protein
LLRARECRSNSGADYFHAGGVLAI